MSLEAVLPESRLESRWWGAAIRALDARVLAPALLLVVIGLVSLWSDRPTAAVSQAKWLVVGMSVLLVTVLIPYRRMLDLLYPAYGVSLVLLVLVLVLGRESHRAQRWLDLGPIGCQPSEIAKVAVIAALARYIRFRRDQRTFKGLLIPFLLTLVPLALIVKQPDLGTALMLVPVLFAMLWASGARTRHLLTVVLLGVASLPVVYVSLAPYQQRRIHTFVAPVAGLVDSAQTTVGGWFGTDADTEIGETPPAAAPTPAAPAADPRVDSYHVRESLAAVAGGGLFGQGWRRGVQNQKDLVPESWTDFIFVVHAEEWGFAGVVVLLLAEIGLLIGLASVAREVKEPAGRLLAVGALVLFGTQASVNLAMTVGLAPITGLPLPFLSYGGSSMFSSWLLLGLVLNARGHRPLVFAANDFD